MEKTHKNKKAKSPKIKTSLELKDKEINKTIEQIQTDLDEYDKKTAAICKKTDMTKEQLEKYVNDPKNFSVEEWKVLQEVRGEIEEFRQNIWSVLNKDADEIDEKIKKKHEKKKKSRIVGMKKKNWIPMP